MTRSELDRMKETLKKGMLFDGIAVDERPQVVAENQTLSPVVLSATHIGWELIDNDVNNEDD